MKLPANINPVHCASKDGSRYVLNSVSIQGDLAVSTDGRSLFAVKGARDADDDPRSAIIPRRVASAAWPQGKGKRGVLPMLTINPVDSSGLATCTVMNRDLDKTNVKEIDGTFPNVEKVIPNSAKYAQRVGLNVKFLLNIAKCFGEDEIVIHFNPDGWRDGMQDECMMITSKSLEAFGILMPCRSPGSLLKDNQALAAIKERTAQREAEEQAEREAAAAAAKAVADAEAARIEADREKTEAWLAANPNPTNP